MKLTIITILALLFCFSFVSAAEGIDVRIINNSLTIQGFIITDFAGKVPAGFIKETNSSLSTNPFVCEDLEVTEGNTTRIVKTNCTLNIDYHKEIFFNFNDSTSTIIGDTELQRKYEECLTEKADYNAGLNSCNTEKNKRVDNELNYTNCKSDLRICQDDKSDAEKDYSELQTEQKENSNKHWIWGAVGAALGMIATLYYKGFIGGPKAKTPEDSYNRQQSA